MRATYFVHILLFWFLTTRISFGGGFDMRQGSKFSLLIEGRAVTILMEDRVVNNATTGEKLSPFSFFRDGRLEGGGFVTSSVVVATDDVEELKRDLGLSLRPIPFSSAFITKAATPRAALELAEALHGSPAVRYAHPDLILPLDVRSRPTDEPLFGFQWNLANRGQTGGRPGADIGVETVWQVTRGSPNTVVGVLDVGFEQNHRDLSDAWYINEQEIPGNKKDDDRNGLVDDVSGWNFSTNSNNLIYGSAPHHGTATAGVLAARANGIGISGVCPECKLLPIVVSGRVSEDASAIGYAVAMGVTVMSNSWGYALESPRTDIVSEALATAARSGRSGLGVPILFAMRNSAVNDCRSAFPDISAHPDVIAVSSIDHNDVKVPNAGFGSCLALLGPSSGSSAYGIPSTDRLGASGYNKDGVDNFEELDFHKGFWGTSAATPNVAGLMALLLSHEPTLTRQEALSRMKASAIKVNPEAAQYDAQTGHSLHYGFGKAHGGALFESH